MEGCHDRTIVGHANNLNGSAEATLKTRIREVRRAAGLTLAEVAARCVPPTTAQTIGRLETGMRTVSMGWLTRIAGALAVPPSELVTLSSRADLPLAALLGASGAIAPAHTTTLSPPAPLADEIAMLVEVGQGDYRAGDQLWLKRLAPARYGDAMNRDILIPRSAGRLAFGRLVDARNGRINLVPVLPGARQLIIEDAPWIAVVRILIRSV